jgi:4-alpha-glucanotransferase
LAQAHLSLLLHAHQPVGNFDHVIEEAYGKAYLPFVDLLAGHPKIRLSLHYTGYLLEWIEKRHPEFFLKLRRLVEHGQVELVGGGYYEPILTVIPDRDKLAQLTKLRDYIISRFGVTPRGAWLAERVWEPSLARPLAEAGVEYVMLDDTHFMLAGLHASELEGYYITEDAGYPLRLVPSLKTLRYTIPFREPVETIDFLRQGLAGSKMEAPLFAMGDDAEKFGSWPGTFEHCYQNRWLERFFEEVEQAQDWMHSSTLSDYLGSQPPLGRVYLPTASYEEMMIWAMPFEAGREFRACLAEAAHLPGADRFQRFLRGGFWRNFLAKYPESNQIHKLMLEVSSRLERARQASGKSFAASFAVAAEPNGAPSSLLAEAEKYLLASQCNDAYWHGIFGGLYTPHLRAGVLRPLIRAESMLDRIEVAPPGRSRLRVRSADFDCDGHEEILVDHPLFGMVLRPSDGGTVSSLRFKPAEIDLINSLARRAEPYHAEVRESAGTGASVSSTLPSHSEQAARTQDLSAFLRYDRYPRHVFRTWAFPASKQWLDYYSLVLEESAELAGGGWTLRHSKPVTRTAERAEFEFLTEARFESGAGVPDTETHEAPCAIRASKSVIVEAAGTTWRLECHSRFGVDSPISRPVRDHALAFGLELVFNLLAPDAAGRYFHALGDGDRMKPLGFGGELEGPKLLVVDEWQGVKISLEVEPAPVWWIAPIDTVSQSEAGFERVYQGSSVLAVWKPESQRGTDTQGGFSTTLTVEIEAWQPSAS